MTTKSIAGLLIFLTLLLGCRSPKAVLFGEEIIECNGFRKILDDAWEEADGYYTFDISERGTKAWSLLYVVGNECLIGMSKRRFIRSFGEPSFIEGQTFYYFMEKRCLPDELEKYCNIQGFTFASDQLQRVEIIKPWTKNGMPLSVH